MTMVETSPPTPAQFQPIDVDKIAVRMANEGIPIRAICRATKLPSDDLRLVLQEAMDRGCLLQLPNEDWPKGSARETRCPSVANLASLSDELLDCYIGHVFNATRLEASVLIPLIKRPEVSREGLHQAIEDRRPSASDQTDPKMVDVVICKLRKKLKIHELLIATNWSRGYSMSAEHRKKAADMIMEYASKES